VRLTEEDTEYAVFCVKHIYEQHVVFQFNCTNTIAEQVLEDVSVAMDLADAVSCRADSGVRACFASSFVAVSGWGTCCASLARSAAEPRS
jgi:hypothetical protein